MNKMKLNKVFMGLISVVILSLATGCSTDNHTTEKFTEGNTSSVKMSLIDTETVTEGVVPTIVTEFNGDSGTTYQLKVANLEQKQLDLMEEVIYPRLEETATKYELKTVEILTVDLETDSEGLLSGVVRTFAKGDKGDTDQTLSIQGSKVVLYFEGSFDKEE